MFISWRNAALLLIISVVLFSSTFLETRDAAIIPFKTIAGHTGTIRLDLPRRVFTGDAARLSARVALSAFSGGDLTDSLAGRLEAGFEELAPVGRVTLNLKGGSEVELIWKLRTGKSIEYPATLWLWLLSDSGEALLLARDFTLDSRSYLGVDVSAVRITSAFLMFISLLMAGFALIRRPGIK